MLRPALVIACVVVAATVLSQASASPTVVAWPGTTITYRDMTSRAGFHRAVAAAVAAWNRLDLGVQLEPGQVAADVTFSLARGRCLGGKGGAAPLGFRAAGSRIVLSRSCPVVVRRLLLAHELGRALGLPVDDSRCSLMNSRAVSDGWTYVVPAKCSRRHPPAWIRSLIDPATAQAARLMYTPPLAPGAIQLSVDAQGVPQVSWTVPAQTTPATTVLARAATCPTDRDVATGAALELVDEASSPGSRSVADPGFPPTGVQCYSAFELNQFGRAAAAPDSISYELGGPVAGFAVTGSPVAGTTTSFSDTSQGGVGHWTWNFGDPDSGTADVVDTSDPTLGRAPTHDFAQPGNYDVTLTVTDAAGRTSSLSDEIVVGAAS